MPSAPDLEHLAIDPDGDVQLADRARDVIKSGGE